MIQLRNQDAGFVLESVARVISASVALRFETGNAAFFDAALAVAIEAGSPSPGRWNG